MLGFSPFKKHANKFNYVPRYFNPEKEAREQRRAELHGERSDDAGREYRPGQYIRTQRDARAARRAKDEGKGRMHIWKMVGAAVFVLLFIYLLYPKLVGVFVTAHTTPVSVQTQQAEKVDGFDPSAPITIVPNDYQE